MINQRAFHGLTEENKLAAARSFYAALKPGGECCMETLNVSSMEAREKMEDILIRAGFCIPFLQAERWLQRELEKTARIK